jgi:galactokinase
MIYKNFESEIKSVNKIKLSNLFTNDEESLLKNRNRFGEIIKAFNKKFNLKPASYFSVPGRTEISGNHTDHNHGKVIAASINLDSIACVREYDSVIEIFSEGYEQSFVVNLENLEAIDSEAGTTNALIRGIASRFVQNGFNIGGFNACFASDVLQGSGLSSSASIEVLIGSIFNHLYNDGKILPEEIARIGQYAENVYFKKPCGLMDQMACAIGGIISIDFSDTTNPIVDKLDFDFSSTGYKLVVVDTEGSHSNLTDEYSAIPKEMKQVSNYFGKEYCSEITLAQLIPNIKSLRNKLSDRAILRAIHFLEENKRVEQQKDALKKNEFVKFLQLVNESGNSSYKYLQNIYSSKEIERQEVSLALALSDIFIKENGKGACRVHGGGFAGTIQVFLPDVLVEKYKAFITKIFNEDSVKVLSIRQMGAVQILLD